MSLCLVVTGGCLGVTGGCLGVTGGCLGVNVLVFCVTVVTAQMPEHCNPEVEKLSFLFIQYLL